MKTNLEIKQLKQLLNSVIAKYHDLSVSRRSIIDQLATDKLQYFAQPRPIIVNYYTLNSLTLFWLAERVQWIIKINAHDVITADIVLYVKDTDQGHG